MMKLTLRFSKARISSVVFLSLAAGLLSGFSLFLCIITTSCLRLRSRKNALLLNNRRYLFSLRRLIFGLPIWSLFWDLTLEGGALSFVLDIAVDLVCLVSKSGVQTVDISLALIVFSRCPAFSAASFSPVSAGCAVSKSCV